MGIRSLGLTCAECIMCWLLSCHLETISIEMVSATRCVLHVPRGTAQHSPGSGSQKPFASCRISSLKRSEALPSRPSSNPLLSLPFPPLLELENNDTCRGEGGLLISILVSFLAHLVGLKQGWVQISHSLKSPQERSCILHSLLCAFCKMESLGELLEEMGTQASSHLKSQR